MKRPIGSIAHIRQYRTTILSRVKAYGGQNIRILETTPEGDLAPGDIRLLIEFPDRFRGLVARSDLNELEKDLFSLLGRWVQVINPAEEPPDIVEQMNGTAVKL